MNQAEFHREIAECVEKGIKVVVATVIGTNGSSPGRVGQKLALTSKGETFGTAGGGGLEQSIIADAKNILGGSEVVTKKYSLKPEKNGGIGMMCGGEAEVLIEPIGAVDQLVIFGGGHIGKLLADISGVMGYSVFIVDQRPEYSSPERFPGVARLITKDVFEPALADELPADAPFVILTHNHDLDRKALANVLGFATGYIGMIGSKRKIKTIFTMLEEDGIPCEKLSKVHSPIGLEISAKTPEEIAISILAEIIQYKHKHSGSE